MEERLAWIIYKTYAVVPSNTLPVVSKGKAYFSELAPNIQTKNCPKAKTAPDPTKIYYACLS